MNGHLKTILISYAREKYGAVMGIHSITFSLIALGGLVLGPLAELVSAPVAVLVGVGVVGVWGFAAKDVLIGEVISGGEDLVRSDFFMLLKSCWLGMKSPSVSVYCWWCVWVEVKLLFGLLLLSLSLSLNTVSIAVVVGSYCS